MYYSTVSRCEKVVNINWDVSFRESGAQAVREFSTKAQHVGEKRPRPCAGPRPRRRPRRKEITGQRCRIRLGGDELATV